MCLRISSAIRATISSTKGNIMRKKYGFWNFVLDAALVLLTGGLWLIWIFVREMRRRR